MAPRRISQNRPPQFLPAWEAGGVAVFCEGYPEGVQENLGNGHFGCVQVDNLPSGGKLLQDDCAAVYEAGSVVEMEGDDGDVSGDLNFEGARLNVHVGAGRPAGANLLKDLAKGPFEFCAAVGTVGNGAGIKDGGIVGEGGAKAFPVEVVEGLNEGGESLGDVLFFGRGFVLGRELDR